MNDYYSDLQLKNFAIHQINLELEIDESIEGIDVDFKPQFSFVDDDQLSGVIDLRFYLKNREYKIEGICSGLFSFDEKLGEEEKRQLLSANGTAILFPHLRASISSITQAANLNTLIIPTINIIKFLDEKYSVENNT